MNPPGVDDRYLRGLRAAFGMRWTRSMYRFYLRRAFAGQPPDRLVIREGGRVVSGVGVNYRSLRLANGATIPAAILTAGWTLPSSRGRGLFGSLMESAILLVARRGCALALAFARGDNASVRTLRRLGAHMLPTTYFSSDSGASPLPTTAMNPRVRSVPPAAIQSAAREAAGGAARFEYPRPEDWRLQFLERPYPVETLSIGDCMAIIERTGGSDRLQLLTGGSPDTQAALGALALRSRLADRRFLAFGFGETGWERTGPPGMTTEPGHFALLVTSRETLAAAIGIPVRRGLPASGDLSSPLSPWYLGDWRIQPGDRM